MKTKYCYEYDEEKLLEELKAKYLGNRDKLDDALKRFEKFQEDENEIKSKGKSFNGY